VIDVSKDGIWDVLPLPLEEISVSKWFCPRCNK